MGDWFEQNKPAAGNWFDRNKPAPSNGVGDFVAGVASQLNPVAAVKGLAQTAAHPIDTAKAILEAQGAVGQKAADSFAKGNYVEGVRHAINYLIPMIGPAADAAGDKAQAGQVARGAGEGVGIGLGLAAPEVLKKIPSVKVSPKVVNPNPEAAAALDYLESKGVPVPAGARTGNQWVKNVQKGVDSTPVGAVVAQRAQTAATKALRAESENLVQRALPEVSADTHYSAFRAAEADPANIRTVIKGTKQAPTGVVDPKGNPVMRDVPVTESIGLPANVAPIKEAIRPIFEDINKWWEPAKRNVSAGYQAMKSILDGPDVLPASQAEAGLSGLKAMSRDADPRSAGIAKLVIPKLQAIVDDAAAKGGPEVVKALQKGRKAAAAEMGAAKLQSIFDKATAEGGFNREAGIWHDWQRARPDIERQLPAPMVSDLDKFFLGAKKLAENPNPSGTALTGISMGSGALIYTNPLTGATAALSAGAVSKLLHSPRGVRLLTEGMKVPLGKPAAAASIVSQILKLAGDDVKQVTEAGPSARTGPLVLAPAQ